MGRTLPLSNKKSAILGLFGRLVTRPQTLDLLAIGIMEVDSENNVLFSNDEAKTILNVHDGLFLVRGQLELNQTAARRAFVSALKLAWMEGVASTLRVPRPSGRLAYQCAIEPLGCDPGRPGAQKTLAAIVLTDPERLGRGPERFAALYGLTPKQAHLAELMAQGQTLESASKSMDIRPSTVRTHLKQLMQKVGAQRQGELISLLLKAPPVRRYNTPQK